jgi:hypothetical protein
MSCTRRKAVLTLVAIAIVAAVGGQMSAAQAAPSSVRCKVFHLHHVFEVTGPWPGGLETIKAAEVDTSISRCFNGRRVIRPNVSCKYTFQDWALTSGTTCKTQGSWFPWRGNPYGGYDGVATYDFDVCVVHVGCVAHVNYNHEARLYADGNSEKV